MKEDLNANPRNQKSMNLTLILRRNRRLNREDFSETLNREIVKIKIEIKLNYDPKLQIDDT